ncbi:MAG: serine hydrolase domain-containing protein [Bacteroidota bacterium]
MKKLFFSSILLFLVGTIAGQSKLPDPEKLLTTAIREKACVGIAAGYTVDGKTVWTAAKGWKNKAEKIPFEMATTTRIASIAKPMTAIAIMQLYEAGKIDLDAPVQKYVLQFPTKKEGEITVRHLLQHASGIGAYQSKKEANNKKAYPTLADAAKVFQDRDLLAEPGTAFNYTSYGYVVLGLVIEGASGMTYEEYMQKNIWDKIGMTHTGIEKSGTAHPNQSLSYHRNKKGKLKKAKPSNLSNRIPGGGFYSNVADLLKFGNAILDHTLVKASTLEMMIADAGLKKEGNGYGLGWYLYGENPTLGKVIGHNGAQLGCSSFLFILPEQNITTVVISNTSGALQEVSNIGIQLFHIAGTEQVKRD